VTPWDGLRPADRSEPQQHGRGARFSQGEHKLLHPAECLPGRESVENGLYRGETQHARGKPGGLVQPSGVSTPSSTWAHMNNPPSPSPQATMAAPFFTNGSQLLGLLLHGEEHKLEEVANESLSWAILDPKHSLAEAPRLVDAIPAHNAADSRPAPFMAVS
jgi:hypothetical protein